MPSSSLGQEWPFCHGIIDRTESEARLKGGAPGTYLIRCKDANSFVFSVIEDGRIKHSKIDFADGAVLVEGTVLPDVMFGIPGLMDIVTSINAKRKEAGKPVQSYLPRPSNPPKAVTSTSRLAKTDKRSGLVTSPDVMREGRMKKRAVGKTFFGLNNWKERWFVLCTSDLTYYDSQRRGKEKGKVKVSGIRAAEKGDPTFLKRKNVLILVLQLHTLYVQCANAQEQEGWLVSSLLVRVLEVELSLHTLSVPVPIFKEALRELIKKNKNRARKYHPGLMKNDKWNCCQADRKGDPCIDCTDFPGVADGGVPPSVVMREAVMGKPGDKGDLIPPPDYTKEWYVGNCPRAIAESMVMSASAGDYLVRRSTDGSKLVVVINDVASGKVANYQVFHYSCGQVSLNGNLYPSLEAIFESMQVTPPAGNNGTDIKLGKPVIIDGVSAIRSNAKTGGKKTDPVKRTLVLDFDDAEEENIGQPDNDILLSPLDDWAFLMLDPHETYPHQLPEYARGRAMNRYYDILPNPTTRVILQMVDGLEESSYINANFVRGYGGREARKYIAAQGPEAAQIESFIRMIWERKVPIVIMLTGLVEMSVVKCARYWPEFEGESEEHGSISVQLNATYESNGFVKNVLELTKGNETRKLDHYWYNTWPDHGVPSNAAGEMDPTNCLNLVRLIRQERRGHNDQPIVVHCSAGIGRTGTFIAIDHAISAILAREEVNLLDTIDQIREDRMGMIQHTEQYKFVYQAVIDYARLIGGYNDVRVLTMSAVRGDAKVQRQNSYLQMDSMKKDGAWKLAHLDDNLAQYELRHDATNIRPSVDDKEIIGGRTEPFTREESVHSATKVIPLTSQPWFRSGFTRQQVNEVLTDSPTGSFLCRESSQPGMYAISIQAGRNPPKQAGSEITNILCLPERMPDGSTKFKLGDHGDRFFSTISEMVEYFMRNPYTQNEVTGELMMFKMTQPIDEGNSVDSFGGTGLEHIESKFSKSQGGRKVDSLC